MLDGIVEDWIGPVAAVLRRSGISESVARAVARLGVAVSRGLLLDVLATGDDREVDEAMEGLPVFAKVDAIDAAHASRGETLLAEYSEQEFDVILRFF